MKVKDIVKVVVADTFDGLHIEFHNKTGMRVIIPVDGMSDDTFSDRSGDSYKLKKVSK